MRRYGLAFKVIWSFGLIGLTSQSGCTGTGDGAADLDEVVSESDSVRQDDGDEGDGTLALGPLKDDNIKQAIHDALEDRLDQSDKNADAPAIELGNIQNFQFTIVKMTAGKDDVSGGPSDKVDGLEVEVTGWLRRIGGAGSGGDVASDSCASFDTTVPVKKDADNWSVPAEYGAAFSREDQEDCF